MAKAHDRILEIVVTADESDDDLVATAVNYYRHRGKLDASEGKSVAFTAGAASATHEIELGEVTPPPSIIRLTSTFQA